MQAKRVTDSVLLLELEGDGVWTKNILWSIGYNIYQWKHKSAAGRHSKKSVIVIKMFGMMPQMPSAFAAHSMPPLPGMGPPQPGMEMPQPGMGMPQPGMGMPQPGMGVPPLMSFDDSSIYMANAGLNLQNAELLSKNKKLEDAQNRRIAVAESQLTKDCREVFSNINDKEALRREKDLLIRKAASDQRKMSIRKCYVQALSRLNKLSQRRRRSRRSSRKRRRNRYSTKKKRTKKKGSTRRFAASQHLIR